LGVHLGSQKSKPKYRAIHDSTFVAAPSLSTFTIASVIARVSHAKNLKNFATNLFLLPLILVSIKVINSESGGIPLHGYFTSKT